MELYSHATVVPILLEKKYFSGKVSYSNCSATLINQHGKILTAAHFINKYLDQHNADKIMYKKYINQLKTIKHKNVNHVVKRKLLEQIAPSEDWLIDFEMYGIGSNRNVRINKGGIKILESLDIATMYIDLQDKNLKPVMFAQDELEPNKITVKIIGYTFEGKNPFLYSNYQMRVVEGVYEGYTQTGIPNESIDGKFGVVSEGAFPGMSGGPVISYKGICGIQSMTDYLDPMTKLPTKQSKSYFSPGKTINLFIQF